MGRRGVNILHLHPGPDTGGQSMGGKAVLEDMGDEVRVFVHGHHPFGYPKAQIWDDAAVRESMAWADTLVIHNDPAVYDRVGSHRNVIVHHHGSRFRSDPVRISEQAVRIGARQVVSTVDLLLHVPAGHSVKWFPQIVDVERMQEIRSVTPRPSRPTVVHAPTNKHIKGTRHVIGAKRDLRDEMDIQIVMHQPWWACLMAKAKADVFVDQLNLGYGNNAIEAWAMGIPVMAGATPDILAIMRSTFGETPFHVTDDKSLVSDLRAFMADDDLRRHWADVGQRHVDLYHAPEAWAARARRIFAGQSEEAAA